MRLWHIDLVPILPKKQLVSQWRECSAIVNRICICGSPQHGLVNKILKYNSEVFIEYIKTVYYACVERGIQVSKKLLYNMIDKVNSCKKYFGDFPDIKYRWHTNRYLWQCYYNLQEKYDCELINVEEFEPIVDYCLSIKYEH